VRTLIALFVPAIALASPLPPGARIQPRCPDHSCKSFVIADSAGVPIPFTSPQGFGANDIQAMYHIDPSLGDGLTVAVVDAYGYVDLEADLAVYRAQYGLPECKLATGCLTIYNNNGDTTPLAGDSDKGWIGETALDVQMVSAACPKCKIVVVQAATNGAGLEIGQNVARAKAVDAISNSWGGGENPNNLMQEGDYNNPGIGTFASTGDNGYDGGASYPATSAFVVAVGGTSFDGTTNTAWSGAGSACSVVIFKQPWAPNDVACTMRGAADVSAIADPQTGVASYIAKQGGWQEVGGTSAASPIVAAIFAAAGHADARPQFIYKHRDAFLDVVGGSTGTCGGPLCNGVPGWDGPTGVGIPDQSKLLAIGNAAGAGPAVAISFPSDAATVKQEFTIQVAPDPAALWVDIQVDGVRVERLGADPWTTSAPPMLADGKHTVTAIAYDLDHNSQTATVSVTIGDTAPKASGTCSAGGSGSAGGLVIVGLAALTARRRKR
jgi:MYXO-CTERM domain-containing protein